MRKTKTISTDPGNTKDRFTMSHAEFERLDDVEPKVPLKRAKQPLMPRRSTWRLGPVGTRPWK